jgi:ribosomal protein S18 acetylase RimI-like enzyme
VEVRPIGPDDAPLVAARWGDAVARRGELVPLADLAGFAAVEGDEVVGVVTWAVRDDGGEVVTLEAFRPRGGVGRRLLAAVAEAARLAGADRLWLVTTDDNRGALAFCGALGFTVAAVRPGAVDTARRTLKPSIPEVGHDGVAIHDEIELHRPL